MQVQLRYSQDPQGPRPRVDNPSLKDSPSAEATGECFIFFFNVDFFSKGGLKSQLKFNGMAPFLYLQVILIILMNIFNGLSLTCHSAEYQIGSECCPKCLSGKNQLNDECMCFLSTQLRHNKKRKSKLEMNLLLFFIREQSENSL